VKILAVSAHPDDETLGCGGTLLKHGAAGDALDWLIATRPGEARFDAGYIARRREQIGAVQQAYGFGTVHQMDFPAAELDAQPLSRIIGTAVPAIQSSRPDRVYIVHPGDVHSDHRIIFEAVWAALKPFSAGRPIEVFCYETASSTDMAPPLAGQGFLANAYSEIGPFLERKLDIFRLYESEVQAPPGPRSIEAVTALALARGAAAGMGYAEAFAAMRVIL
jgi:LmbE family N-acetylglucosaminyl deacetylase